MVEVEGLEWALKRGSTRGDGRARQWLEGQASVSVVRESQ